MRRTTLGFALGSALLIGRPALAQSSAGSASGSSSAAAAASPSAAPSEADRATARELALGGYKALQNKDYKTAADDFGRADSLVHAPTLVVDWGRALVGLGKYVEAHERFELVLREGVPADAPKPWQHALEDARKELDQIKPKLAWVTVVLKDPPDATVTIDGATVPPAAIGIKRAANPGSPIVRVTKDGYAAHEETITVGPGDEKTIEVSLTELPKPEAPPETPSPTYSSIDESSSGSHHGAAFVMLGIGGAALIAGSVTGVLALGKHSDLQKICKGDSCPSSAKKDIDSYHLLGTISGVSLAVGVVSVGTGIVLLATGHKSSSDAPPSTAKLHVEPLIGLGMLGATGTFQ